MTRPDPTNHQAANRAASDFKGANVSRVEELEAENLTLRRIIKRHYEDAQWAVKQEGPKYHGHCEGHAVCDLITSAIYDGAALLLKERR